MQFFKKMILSTLLLSSSPSFCSDPMATMATVAVANLAIQSIKDLCGYFFPSAEQKLNTAVAEEKIKYAVAEQELSAITVEDNLEYAKARQVLKQCLRAKNGKLEKDKQGYPVGCEALVRAFIRCGGKRDVITMMNDIDESYSE
ncbi:MAG: hypothetical protein Q8Q60_00130 [Candidatus Chromulinivorax sp.]|nr:hypothetical protein [Candidatus Chromulinivorax sp.]